MSVSGGVYELGAIRCPASYWHAEATAPRQGFFAGRHAGVYTPTTAQGWKEIVMLEAASLAGQQIEGPLALGISFILPRPKAHKKETFVTTKPDLDSLLKATMDALTDRAVWRDDAQIAEVRVSKAYESTEALPGAVIEIYRFAAGE